MIGYVVAAVAVVVAVALGVLLASARRQAAGASERERASAGSAEAAEALGRRLEADLAAAAAAATEAEERRRRAEAAASETAASARAADGRVAAAEGRARDAERRAASAEAGAGTAQRIAVALWDLAELDHDWARRAEAELSTAPTGASAVGLAGALELQVTTTREETGTPGELRLAVDPEPAPADCLLVLRALQMLVRVLARHCDGYRLEASSGPGHVTAVLTCEGFDGGPDVVDDARTLAQALGGAGVQATVTAGAPLEARLVFPVTPAG